MNRIFFISNEKMIIMFGVKLLLFFLIKIKRAESKG